MKTNNGESDRLDRLPRWARTELSGLRSRIAYLESVLATVAGDDQEGCNAFLNPFSQTPVPLGKNPTVKFATGGSGIEGFTVQFKDGALLIQGMATSYEEYMAVLPISGNYIEIRNVKKES